MNNIKLLTEYSIQEYILLIFSILILISFVYYVIPLFNISHIFIEKEKEAQKRKLFIKQIATQRNINDEIEKELNI
jgi:hypothetical protein